MEEESFTESFSRLCDIHSQPDHPAVVFRQRFVRQRHKRLLKKTLYNALFQSTLSKPCEWQQGSQMTDLDEVYSRAYVMRCQRRFGNAKRLEELVEGFLSGDKPEEKKDLLRFLLCLADTGQVTQGTDFGHRQIQLPALLNNRVEMLPVDSDFCHGDDVSLGVSSEHWFTVYPSELFGMLAMKGTIPWQNTSMSDAQIFELKPGNSLQGHGIFSIAGSLDDTYESHRKLTLFGALTHCRDNDLQMSLGLPEMMASCPAHIIPPKLHDVSTDEGFEDAHSEASQPASPVEEAVSKYELDSGQCRDSIWQEALEATPSRHYVWEASGRPSDVLERPYLTEAGPELFDHLLEVLMEQLRLLYPSIYLLHRSVIVMSRLVADAINLLIGVSSNTFLYNKDLQVFHLSENISVSGLSSEALQEVCGALVECGTNYSRLKAFSESPTQDTLISRAFCSAVWKYLQHYCGCVLSLPRITSVLQLNMTIQPIAAQVRFLAELCQCAADSGDSQLPSGVPLLSYVYTHTLRACSSPHYPMMLSLLNAACVPYVMFLQDWVFHGVCRDAYGEFMIQVNDDFLVRRDKNYWLSGYKLVLPDDADSVPLFLADMMADIFTCGKTINLLRLISPQHFLFGIEYAVPRVMITFSQEELADIETQSQDYMVRVQQTAKAHTVNRKEKKLQAERAKHNLQIKARKVATEAIEKIQETADAARRLEDDKKRELFAQLKDQMERDLERRALTTAQVKENDRLMAEAAKARPWMQPSVSDQVQKAAREELIEKYAKLTDAALYREQKALWQVERHKLDTKRTEYLQREAAGLMEELQQRPLVPMTGAGDAVDASQGTTVDQIGIAGDDALPNWARTRGGLSGPSDSQSDLPAWARVADSDPIVSVWEDSEGLPQWAKRGLSGEGEQMGDVLKGSPPTVVGDIPNQSEGDTLKMSSDGDIFKQSSDGNILKQSCDNLEHPTGSIPYPLTGVNLGHPSDATVGDLLKQSSDGDFLKQSSDGNILKQSCDNLEHPTGSILYPLTGVTLGHPSDASVGDLLKPSSDGDFLKQSSDGDILKQSFDTVKHPTPGSIPRPLTGVTLGHPSDATVGNLLYPSGDTPDGQSLAPKGNNAQTREQASDVIMSSTMHGPEVAAPATIIQPATEIKKIASANDDHKTSETAHDIDTEKKPVDTGDTDTHSEVTRHHPVPRVTKPGFFGHVSEQARADNSITVQRTSFNPTMHATKESDWTDFTVRCNRRRRVVGQDIGTETQEETSHRPHIKMNRWVGASTESEHVDASTMKMKRFRELNVHQRHSSDSTVQTLLYGRVFGAIQETQAIIEEEVPREHMELWADTSVEPYQDNYDCLDDPPAVNLMSKMSEHTLFEHYGFATGDNVEAHKYMPLTALINRSVMAPLTVQIKVVNENILSHFSVDLNIDQHFKALQHFLLLADGEFSQSLTDQLFDKLSQGIQPQEMLNPVHLNGVLTRALQYSLHGDSPYAKNISFSLKYFPSVLRQNAVDALDCLDLTYKVAWPLNIVITDTCIGKYSRVLSFMLQLKRVAWLTSDLWHKLKRDGLVSHTDRSTQYRQLQLYRHEMQHFVKVIQSYIANQIIDVTWHEFQQDLEQCVHNLDDLHQVHVKYLNKCIFRCLLTPNAALVMKVIHDIFTLILKFHTQLHLGAWTQAEDSGEMNHPHFEGMAKSYRAFNVYSTFLFKVVSKLAARGYQPHLQELVLRLNFNNYYSDNVRLSQQAPY